jgi:hypothetical protein
VQTAFYRTFPVQLPYRYFLYTVIGHSAYGSAIPHAEIAHGIPEKAHGIPVEKMPSGIIALV